MSKVSCDIVLIIMSKYPLTKRFHNSYIPEPMSGCWLWIKQTSKKGYGQIQEGLRRHIAAHRLSYEMHIGEIPKDMLVCHRCDVRCCVNPQHLFIGTPQDNTDDMHRKNRWVKPWSRRKNNIS